MHVSGVGDIIDPAEVQTPRVGGFSRKNLLTMIETTFS
jgi:hypothetical protein